MFVRPRPSASPRRPSQGNKGLTVGDRLDPQANGFSLIRLCLALTVVIGHSWPLGLGQPSYGGFFVATHSQLDSVSVWGFFVVSGYLVTSSALRSRPTGFLLRRALRILPPFWTCLLVTAFLLAPLLALRSGALHPAWWTGVHGPLRYVISNAFTGMRQYGISDLLLTTPYGRLSGVSVLDGSLWSLQYEAACYGILITLLTFGWLAQRPWITLALCATLYATIVSTFVFRPSLSNPVIPGAIGPLPLLGYFNVNESVYLAFLFLLGASMRLYRHRIPLRGRFAVAALVVVAATAWRGGFAVLGLPLLAYLLVYAAATTPPTWRRIGPPHDYSYGIYLYAFPVQQILAEVGMSQHGLVVYLGLTLLMTAPFVAFSCYLIERPAARLGKRATWRPPQPAGPAAADNDSPHARVSPSAR